MPPGSDEYFAALRQARERGFAISAEALRQVDAALAAAARQVAIQIGRGADPLQRQRLASLLEQIIGVLDELGDRIARVTSQGVNLTINDLLRIHERINSALSNRFLGRGVIGLGASFDRLPARILGILAARPGGSARTFRTLINRHLLEAAPSLDVLLTQSIVRGVPISRLARDIAGLLTNPPGTTLPWVDPSQASGFSTIRSDSRRIAASETLNALRETNAQALNVSPLVLAVRWQRSGRHDAITSSPDECDILAETDFHGLGAGFYPPDLWPLAPHPYCGCYQGEVIMRRPSEWGQAKPKSPPADLDRMDLERFEWSELRSARAERTVARSLGRKPPVRATPPPKPTPPKVDPVKEHAEKIQKISNSLSARLPDRHLDTLYKALKSPKAISGTDALDDLRTLTRDDVTTRLEQRGISSTDAGLAYERHAQLMRDWVRGSSTDGGNILKLITEETVPGTQTTFTSQDGFIDSDQDKRLGFLTRVREHLEERVAAGLAGGEKAIEERILHQFATGEEAALQAQAALRLIGVGDTVTVYRGVPLQTYESLAGKEAVVGQTGHVSFNSLSSWSMSKGLATEFIEDSGGVVLRAEIPITQVRGAWLSERELFSNEVEIMVSGQPVPYTTVVVE